MDHLHGSSISIRDHQDSHPPRPRRRDISPHLPSNSTNLYPRQASPVKCTQLQCCGFFYGDVSGPDVATTSMDQCNFLCHEKGSIFYGVLHNQQENSYKCFCILASELARSFVIANQCNACGNIRQLPTLSGPSMCGENVAGSLDLYLYLYGVRNPLDLTVPPSPTVVPTSTPSPTVPNPDPGPNPSQPEPSATSSSNNESGGATSEGDPSTTTSSGPTPTDSLSSTSPLTDASISSQSNTNILPFTTTTSLPRSMIQTNSPTSFSSGPSQTTIIIISVISGAIILSIIFCWLCCISPSVRKEREKNLRSDVKLLRDAVIYRGGKLRESPSVVRLLGGGGTGLVSASSSNASMNTSKQHIASPTSPTPLISPDAVAKPQKVVLIVDAPTHRSPPPSARPNSNPPLKQPATKPVLLVPLPARKVETAAGKGVVGELRW
ncbi:hypothetical protein BC829DRAFT_52033 [Chytridium lagenaria]|nr:hypothetical protein BC829DRAFT_52033 [Chytridium lagenaria]